MTQSQVIEIDGRLGALGARPLVVGVTGSVGISVVTFALVAGAQAAGWLG